MMDSSDKNDRHRPWLVPIEKSGGNVPEYLLERSRQRRAILEVRTGRVEDGVTSVPHHGLNQRLSGIVDMYGEPCSLLAEHIAIAARRIIESSESYINYPPEDKDLGYKSVRRIADDKENGELLTFLSIPLTPWQQEQGGRLVRLELASELRMAKTKRMLGLIAAREVFASPGQTYLMAVTRTHVGVPVMGIRMDREQPNCSFITLAEGSLDEDTVVVTKNDINNEDRQSKLTVVRKLLDNYYRDFRLTLPDAAGFSSKRYDIAGTGAIDRINQLLGEPDEVIESIVTTLQNLWHEEQPVHEIAAEITDSGIKYPARVKLVIDDSEADTLKVNTTLTLPDAPSFGTQHVFPNLRVYPASRCPLRFDSIDVNTHAHKRMLVDFYELTTKIPGK